MTVFNATRCIPEKLYGIIGHPLGHSLSPLLHNHGFQKLGLCSSYFCWPIPPGKLPEFMTAMRTLPIAGASVTIPHKCTVMPYLDGYSEDAIHAGAVNTLFWKDGKLLGDNTDVQGFLKPLEPHLKRLNSALVLGVGGAARAVLWGLKRRGVEKLAICGRKKEIIAQLSQEFGAESVEWENRGAWQGDLLINATPLGMQGALAEENPWPGGTKNIQIMYDLVYNPLKTKFLREGEVRGARTILGVEMFVAQAMAQFQLWTGKLLDSEELKSLVITALKE